MTSQAVLPDCAPSRGGEKPREAPLCGICQKLVPPKRTRGGSPRKWCSPECGRVAWERAHPGKRGWQAALPGESRVERQFREWIETEDGQVVEAEVIRRARALLTRGVTRYGIASAHLARKVMAENADLAGYFETRDLRGRA